MFIYVINRQITIEIKLTCCKLDEKQFLFRFNRQERPYNTIDDAEPTYNRPWELKTFLPNRSAQALLAGTLSRSVQEDSNGRGRGLARSNTTGGRGTRL
jgi:hypothetical protein